MFFLSFWAVPIAFDKTSSAVLGVGVQWRSKKKKQILVWKMSFELNLQGSQQRHREWLIEEISDHIYEML